MYSHFGLFNTLLTLHYHFVIFLPDVGKLTLFCHFCYVFHNIVDVVLSLRFIHHIIEAVRSLLKTGCRDTRNSKFSRTRPNRTGLKPVRDRKRFKEYFRVGSGRGLRFRVGQGRGIFYPGVKCFFRRILGMKLELNENYMPRIPKLSIVQGLLSLISML